MLFTVSKSQGLAQFLLVLDSLEWKEHFSFVSILLPKFDQVQMIQRDSIVVFTEGSGGAT
jgi:hypothetical protein